jgi:hypothetical protein
MNFGGPVWHASAAHAPERRLKATVVDELAGVGDAGLGEWHEWSGKAYHVRRRLSEDEQKLVGPVIDIRGTVEATMRLMPVQRILPANWGEYRKGG